MTISMRMAVATADGSLDVVERTIAPPGCGEVLVRIAASGLNPLDAKIRAGAAPHARRALPTVLGIDMAGVVEAVGHDVAHLSPGDAVFGMVGGVGDLPGTQATHIVCDAALLAPAPKRLALCEAAALPLVAITAWLGLAERLKAEAGDTLLVQGGAGGVGHVAIQIGRSLGAEVFATGSASQADTIGQLGATFVDRNRPVRDQLAEHTQGRGFDKVFDTAGGEALDASFAAVREGGHVASCLGWGSHRLAPLSFRNASYSGVFTLPPLIEGRGRVRFGAILARIATLVDDGRLRPLVDPARFTLETLEGAFRRQAGARGQGKVVVDIGEWTTVAGDAV